MTLVSYTPNERQLTLLEFIIAKGGVTREDIVASIPAYQGGNATGTKRKIERDLDSLRGAGYPITSDAQYRYSYNQAAPLLAQVNALDVGLLRSLLSGVHTRGPLFSAASAGLHKLLASSSAQSPEAKYVQANIPEGDSALPLARAIQNGQRISFEYESASHAGSRTYELEPTELAEHFDTYFVSGQARRVGPAGAWGRRTFRATRIAEGSLHTVGAATQPRQSEPAESVFTFAEVLLAIRPGCALPLASRGEPVDGPDGEWPRYRFRSMSRNYLFETLATYGLDVRLLGPTVAADEWTSRLNHLAQLGGNRG